MWLTVIAALAACWFADRRSLFFLKSELRLEIAKTKEDQVLVKTERQRLEKLIDEVRNRFATDLRAYPSATNDLLAYPPGPNDL
jgi:uncharacterized protein involved in tolerance to divalent cations